MISNLFFYLVNEKMTFPYLALGLHCVWPDRLCPRHGDDPSSRHQQVWKTLKVWIERYRRRRPFPASLSENPLFGTSRYALCVFKGALDFISQGQWW